MFNEDQDLRRVERLRWRQAEDGLTEAWCLPAKLRKDRLYFHGIGRLAIHYQAYGPRAATERRKWWMKRIGRVVDEREGDWEGILIFEANGPEDIPKEFFRRQATGRPFTPRQEGELTAQKAGEGAPGGPGDQGGANATKKD